MAKLTFKCLRKTWCHPKTNKVWIILMKPKTVLLRPNHKRKKSLCIWPTTINIKSLWILAKIVSPRVSWKNARGSISLPNSLPWDWVHWLIEYTSSKAEPSLLNRKRLSIGKGSRWREKRPKWKGEGKDRRPRKEGTRALPFQAITREMLIWGLVSIPRIGICRHRLQQMICLWSRERNFSLWPEWW